MRRIYKKMFKIFAFIILLFVVILLAVYINHRIRLDKEQELLVPLGEMISVDGNNMSVYKAEIKHLYFYLGVERVHLF